MNKTINSKWKETAGGSRIPESSWKKSVQFGEKNATSGENPGSDSPNYGISSRPDGSPSASDGLTDR
jgi:hypothetical protein